MPADDHELPRKSTNAHDMLTKSTGRNARFTVLLLSWARGPPIVFGALMESCFDDTGASAEEAEKMRAFTEARTRRYERAPVKQRFEEIPGEH